MKSKTTFVNIEKTTKTNIKDHLIISTDLKKLLNKFKWSKFFLT